MQDKTLEALDHQRWLMNAGIVPDVVKNHLFMYGSIAHKNIKAVELSVDVEKKIVLYTLYADKKLLQKVQQFHQWRHSQNWFELWRLRRMLLKEGNLDFQRILSSFVADYLGPKWRVDMKILDYAQYNEGPYELANNDNIVNN